MPAKHKAIQHSIPSKSQHKINWSLRVIIRYQWSNRYMFYAIKAVFPYFKKLATYCAWQKLQLILRWSKILFVVHHITPTYSITIINCLCKCHFYWREYCQVFFQREMSKLVDLLRLIVRNSPQLYKTKKELSRSSKYRHISHMIFQQF